MSGILREVNDSLRKKMPPLGTMQTARCSRVRVVSPFLRVETVAVRSRATE